MTIHVDYETIVGFASPQDLDGLLLAINLRKKKFADILRLYPILEGETGSEYAKRTSKTCGLSLMLLKHAYDSQG